MDAVKRAEAQAFAACMLPPLTLLMSTTLATIVCRPRTRSMTLESKVQLTGKAWEGRAQAYSQSSVQSDYQMRRHVGC